MRKLLSAILCLCITSTYAQKITGKLTDEKGTPVPYASISLLKSSVNTPVKTSLSDSTGKFEISAGESGSFALRITAIGFTENKLTVELATAGDIKNIGTIVLKIDAKSLNNVDITSLRPTIVQKDDRLVVSVEGTAMAAGSNAFSVLSKAPGVFIDPEGNIQLNGRAGVMVQIDGRQTYLSARELRSLLESMPAENLKNIEIITNPSAKYEAEGTSGILNINLKKNTFQGINGSIYVNQNYNFKKQYTYALGGNVNMKYGKWNSFINVDLNKRAGGREATFTRIFYGINTATYFDQEATGNFTVTGPPSVRAGTDYSFNSNHSVGAMVNFVRNTAEQDFLTDTWIGNAPGKPSKYIDANNYSTNTFQSITTNLHYLGKFDTLGTQLSTDFDYVTIKNRGYADLINYFEVLHTNQKTADRLYTNTPNGYNIYSGRIDLTIPVKKQKFEIGGRASKIATDFDFQFYFNNNGLVIDPNRTNHFKYDERILAAYVNWSAPLSKKISLQAGLRMENTNNTANSLTLNNVTRRNYTDFFPSVFLTHKISDNYGINYSYSRRLTRPNYGNLNPFRAYRDPYTWYQGNTDLRPSYTHSFSVAQIIKKIYNLTANLSISKDMMSEVPILYVADTTTVYTTGNVNNGLTAGFTGLAPLKITKKWDSQNTIVLNYSKFKMNSVNGNFENDQLFFMLQSNHTILLPKDFKFEMNFLYRGPAASGLYHMAAMSRVDLALKKSLFKKKLEVTVNANDIFKGYRFIWTADINGNVNDFNQYFRFRQVGLSLRYNFSKGQKVTERKANQVDELNRL